MVKIITDSASDLENHELEKLNVSSVPMPVTFGETEYIPNETMSKDEFYEMLQKEKKFPKTSQPSPSVLMDVFQEAKDNGDELVYITLSSALSGTYNSAVLTKDIIDYEKCYIVDSLSATAGERIMVDIAVKLRDEGKNGSEIAHTLNELRDRILIYACVDNLEYLHKGGRISAAAYAFGTIANVKPIISVTENGKVEVPSKVMGVGKAVKYICNQLEDEEPDLDYPMYVVYTHERTNAEKLVKKLDEYGITEDNITNIGATIGTHVGIGAFGVAYVRKM